MATRADIAGVYAVTAPPRDPAGDLIAKAASVLAGGARVLQYRDKGTDQTRRGEEASALAALAREYGAVFIVNDDIALARSTGADGVHLGRGDVDVATARAALGPDAIIGVSCYNQPRRADEAVTAGADYVAFGSVFPSATKPAAASASLGLLRESVRRLPVPVVAIGGITPANASPVIATGVHAIAAVGALFEVQDGAGAARELSRLFTGAPV